MKPKFVKYTLEDWCASPSSAHDFNFEDALLEIREYPIEDQYLRRGELENAPEPHVSIKTNDDDFLTIIFKENGTYACNMYFKVGTHQRFGLSFEELENVLNRYYFSNHKKLFIELSRDGRGSTLVGSTLYCRFLSLIWGLSHA